MPAPPPAAAAAIIDALDGLLRGLNHALSNRVNTLNTLLAVLQEAPERDTEILDALAAEEARFEQLLRLYRLMPMEWGAAREPLVLADPVKDAVALFGHHLDLRMLPCEVADFDHIPPVRCPRQVLTQAILVMLVAVGRTLDGDEDGHALRLGATATEAEVVLAVTTTRPAGAVDDASWAAFEWLAASVGATVGRGFGDDGHPWASMTLPTLAAERKKGR